MAKKEIEKMRCQGNCKKELAISTNFYQSKSPFFPTGRVNICKKCIAKMIDYNNIDTIYTVMQTLDIPFFYNRWEESLKKKPDNPFGNYIRQANSGINEFEGARWKDSIFQPSNVISDTTKNSPKKINHSFEIEDMTREQLEDKYGIGYTDEEYYCFEKKWRKLADSYGQKTSIHTESLTTYIRFRVKEELATAKGDVAEATKWGGLAEKAQQSGKLNVSQLSKSDISGGVDLLPQLFEAVEDKVGIIPILPKLKEQPYDDADLIIWAIIEYMQRLEDRPRIEYKDIWNFYDDMLVDFYKQKGYSDERIQEERIKRNAVFRDLSEVYKEPLYEESDL
jgi:hypothetical protein